MHFPFVADVDKAIPQLPENRHFHFPFRALDTFITM